MGWPSPGDQHPGQQTWGYPPPPRPAGEPRGSAGTDGPRCWESVQPLRPGCGPPLCLAVQGLPLRVPLLPGPLCWSLIPLPLPSVPTTFHVCSELQLPAWCLHVGTTDTSNSHLKIAPPSPSLLFPSSPQLDVNTYTEASAQIGPPPLPQPRHWPCPTLSAEAPSQKWKPRKPFLTLGPRCPSLADVLAQQGPQRAFLPVGSGAPRAILLSMSRV